MLENEINNRYNKSILICGGKNGKFKKEKDCTNINNFTIISTYCSKWCICIHWHRFI